MLLKDQMDVFGRNRGHLRMIYKCTQAKMKHVLISKVHLHFSAVRAPDLFLIGALKMPPNEEKALL